MNWPWLTLCSAFFLATADTLTKRYLAHYRPGELVLVRFGVAGALLLPLLLLQPWPVLPLAFWGWMTVLLPLELLAMWAVHARDPGLPVIAYAALPGLHAGI